MLKYLQIILLSFCLSIGVLVAQAQSKPNVVIILADDLGIGSVGAYGAPTNLVQTPAIDGLAEEGRKYTQAYTPASLCSPTRYGLLTGQYYWRHVRDWGIIEQTDPNVIPVATNIAQRMKDAGYSTGFAGKWHVGYDGLDPVGGPEVRGFDFTYSYKTGRKGFPLEMTAELLDNATREWINAQSEAEPFFLYFAPIAVHTPIIPGKEYQGSSNAGGYGDFINELDGSVQSLLDALDANGFTDNTIVIFTSDNGAATGAANKNGAEALDVNGGLKGRKLRIFDGGFRVPLIVKWPGNIPANTVSHHDVNLVDIYATLMDVVGADMQAPNVEACDSFSFYNSWFDDANQAARGAMILSSFEGIRAIVSNGWKFIDGNLREPEPYTFFTGFREKKEAHEQLYHTRLDRNEANDLVEVHVSKANELRRLLISLDNQGYSRGTGVIDPNEFYIDVTDGTSNKMKAKEGELVTITAMTGVCRFEEWTDSNDVLTSPQLGNSPLTFMMPSSDVSFTANLDCVEGKVGMWPPNSETITSVIDGKGLKIDDGDVVLAAITEGDDMKWDVTAFNEQSDFVVNAENGRKLTLEDGPVVGTRGTGSTSNRGRWRAVAAKDGSYYLRNDRYKRYLTNQGDSVIGTSSIQTIAGKWVVGSSDLVEPIEYVLTVNNGIGDGDYEKGEKVSISANVPEGQKFVQWNGYFSAVDCRTCANTTVTMPNESITVNATFQTIIVKGLGAIIPTGAVYLANRQTGRRMKPLDENRNSVIVSGSATETGVEVQWTATIHEENIFYIKNVGSDRRIYGADTGGGDIIQKNSSSTTAKCRWTMVATDGGFFHLLNENTGYYMRPSGADAGAKVTEASSSDNSNWTQWSWVEVQENSGRDNAVGSDNLTGSVGFKFSKEFRIERINADDKVVLYNLAGAILFSGKGIASIDLSPFNNGLYLVQVRDKVSHVIKN